MTMTIQYIWINLTGLVSRVCLVDGTCQLLSVRSFSDSPLQRIISVFQKLRVSWRLLKQKKIKENYVFIKHFLYWSLNFLFM